MQIKVIFTRSCTWPHFESEGFWNTIQPIGQYLAYAHSQIIWTVAAMLDKFSGPSFFLVWTHKRNMANGQEGNQRVHVRSLYRLSPRCLKELKAAAERTQALRY